MRPISLDELPRFSPWPARLLGFESWKQRQKSREEVLREYEREKWGPLLERARAAGSLLDLDTVTRWMCEGQQDHVCSEGDVLGLMSPEQSHRAYVDVVAGALSRHADNAPLVELGAGWGNVLLAVLRRAPFIGRSAWAGELTDSGIALIRLIAETEGIRVTAGRCDLSSTKVVDFPVPAGAIVFTSMAIPYIRHVEPDLFAVIASWQPRAVVHIEPCYEHYSITTLLGMLRRRYVEINDYNRNLVSALKSSERAGRIRLLEERPVVFGRNPLFPVSVLVWSPVSRG